MAEGILRVWLKALVAVAPLVTMLGAGVPAQAKAAAAPQITPASGSVITSSSVTIRVKSAAGGGTLHVDGRPVATGKNKWLTYTINGKTTPNGTVKVKLDALIPWDEASSTFRMAVPASAPSGVTASVTANNKVTVKWNKGTEPDLTGYTLSGDIGSKSISAGSCGAQCSVTLAAGPSASGQATIQVVAKRSGAAASGATTRTVRLKGTGQPQTGNDNNSGPAPAPGPSTYTWPEQSQGPALPSVAPNPDGFSTESPGVITYPTPTDPEVLDPSVVSMDSTTGLTGTLADESLQWGKSMAIALVLLLCAAHLGTWTRRLRMARVTGPGGPRVVTGSAHARVEANRLHIEAALAAARGAGEGSSDEDEKGARKPKRGGRFKKGKAEPESPELSSIVRTADPDQDFPDELNLEYTPKSTFGADTTSTTDENEAADPDVTAFDLDRTGIDGPDPDEPETTIFDRSEQDPDGAPKADEKTDAALAALIELAKADAPESAQDPKDPSEEAGDRTEVLEHPRRRRGLFRR
ncbi:hypothetical protein [Actinocorallia aurantiaca]|uniref:hypothetical protein n=1 Tax=Actinocorallia aurantiaca TaxID=46204 RepID=UPI0031CE1AD8